MAVLHLSRKLRAASNASGTNSASASSLSQSRYSALAALHFHGPMNVTELAAHEGVSKPSMSRTLDALEADGFLERTRGGEDARCVAITVTSAGAKAITSAREQGDVWLAAKIAELSLADQDILNQAASLMREMTQE